jgi:hypothetical protein
MQSAEPRDSGLRRSRLPCRVCGQSIELVRLRAHLREAHQVNAAELESLYLDARKTARRSTRSQRR